MYFHVLELTELRGVFTFYSLLVLPFPINCKYMSLHGTYRRVLHYVACKPSITLTEMNPWRSPRTTLVLNFTKWFLRSGSNVSSVSSFILYTNMSAAVPMIGRSAMTRCHYWYEVEHTNQNCCLRPPPPAWRWIARFAEDGACFRTAVLNDKKVTSTNV